MILATVFTLVISSWKEASVLEVKQGSYSCERSSELPYTLVYEVDGKRYGITACAPTPLSTVTYYPGNPSIALINQMVVYKVIAIMLGVLGGVLTVGALFAANTKQPQNSAEANTQTPPMQIPESIVPNDSMADSLPTKKQIVRKFCIFSAVIFFGACSLLNAFPGNTIVTTIVNVVSGTAFFVLLVSAITLNNILRRERKDAGIDGKPQPLTIEEITIRIILGVAIGLVIIAVAIFALSFFYGNSK